MVNGGLKPKEAFGQWNTKTQNWNYRLFLSSVWNSSGIPIMEKRSLSLIHGVSSPYRQFCPPFLDYDLRKIADLRSELDKGD
jgi:hypothetical protein